MKQGNMLQCDCHPHFDFQHTFAHFTTIKTCYTAGVKILFMATRAILSKFWQE